MAARSPELRGFGKPGYCKICAHPRAPEFIKGARTGGKTGKGWNAAEAREFGASVGLLFNRQTWYSHLEHAQTAVMRIEQAAEKTRREGTLSLADIKKTGNTQLLEALRDLGMQRALENPDEVTIDHALKAVQIMEGRKDRGGDQLNILVAFVTGTDTPTVVIERPAGVIEGTSEEITPDGD